MDETKVFHLDQFLGLNEADQSETELKVGESPHMVNWEVTNGRNIKIRPGVTTILDSPTQKIANAWCGYIGSREYMVVLLYEPPFESATIRAYSQNEDGSLTLEAELTEPVEEKLRKPCTKIFSFQDILYVQAGYEVHSIRFSEGQGGLAIKSGVAAYWPVILTGCDAKGGGTPLEQLNALTARYRVQYNGDDTSTVFQLPDITFWVFGVEIDNVLHTTPTEVGSYNEVTKEFTFTHAPKKGVNNITFYAFYSTETQLEPGSPYSVFMDMRFVEYYNGGTDNRLFFYGDGSNLTIYSGAPLQAVNWEEGEKRTLYIPQGNEIRLTDTASPITGMARYYDRLLIFKSDSTYSVGYQPVTLEDGSVIAGFYVHNMSKNIGSCTFGQVQVVKNYPRTIFSGGVYDWRIASTTARDERYAKLMSERIQKTLKSPDLCSSVSMDSDFSSTYYIFLNDEEGTTAVNNYQADTWTVYKSPLLAGVRYAFSWGRHEYMVRDNDIKMFSPGSAFDRTADGTEVPINAVWESAYQSFGADYLRKYSSEIWVSMLPETRSLMEVTAKTDRRGNYISKQVGMNILDWDDADFRFWSFVTRRSPRIKRIKLKVKKFVYYKLVLSVNTPGAKATVLSIDQNVRFAGKAK